MSATLEQRADAAEAIIVDAGELALNYFRSVRDLTIESKGLQDRVSEADRNVEQLIRDALLAQFPQDGFFGEVEQLVNSIPVARIETSGRNIARIRLVMFVFIRWLNRIFQ